MINNSNNNNDDDEHDIILPQTNDKEKVNTNENDLTFDEKEITPIKRYYLISKLINLKNKLNQLNLYDENLNLILKFSNSISFSTLVKLTNVLIKDIEKTINIRSKLISNSVTK